MDFRPSAAPPLDCWPLDSRPWATPVVIGRPDRRSKTLPHGRLHWCSVHRPGRDDVVRDDRVCESAFGTANATRKPSAFSFSFSLSPGFSQVGGTAHVAISGFNRFSATGRSFWELQRLGRKAATCVSAAAGIRPLRLAEHMEPCREAPPPSQMQGSLGGSDRSPIYISIAARFTTYRATRHAAPAESSDLAEIFL